MSLLTVSGFAHRKLRYTKNYAKSNPGSEEDVLFHRRFDGRYGRLIGIYHNCLELSDKPIYITDIGICTQIGDNERFIMYCDIKHVLYNKKFNDDWIALTLESGEVVNVVVNGKDFNYETHDKFNVGTFIEGAIWAIKSNQIKDQ